MHKYLAPLLLVLAACSTTPAADLTAPSSSPTASSVMPGTPSAPSASSTMPGAPPPAPANQTPSTVAPVTPVPSDIKPGDVIPLETASADLGINLASVSYANAILNTVERYLNGEPVTFEVLGLGVEYMKSLPLGNNVIARETTPEGETGFKVLTTVGGQSVNGYSTAYVCLLNSGAYVSLSPCK